MVLAARQVRSILARVRLVLIPNRSSREEAMGRRTTIALVLLGLVAFGGPWLPPGKSGWE
jgi:hypothetical protein